MGQMFDGLSPCCLDKDLSHMGDDEPYDYKFVKWMIQEKVRRVKRSYTRNNSLFYAVVIQGTCRVTLDTDLSSLLCL